MYDRPGVKTMQWFGHISSALSLFLLYFAISGFEGVVTRYQDEPNQYAIIANWAPVVMAGVFGVGWITVHLIEVLLRRALFSRALILFSLYVAGNLVWILNRFFVHMWFANDMNLVGSFLAMSAGALRYSMFSMEALSVLRQRVGAFPKS